MCTGTYSTYCHANTNNASLLTPLSMRDCANNEIAQSGTPPLTAFLNSTGFDATINLWLHMNNLTGTLPASLGNLTNAGSLNVYLDDNLFTGTVPASYASIAAVGVSYNPLLVGPLPAGVTLSSVPTGFSLQGSSVGLDSPLPYLLSAIGTALDPANSSLTNWNVAASLQPCAPYSGQRSGRLGYGGSWTGVTCSDGTAFAPMTLVLDSLPYLAGTVPLRLRELRTATSIKLQRNPLLGGTLPAAWGVNVTWSNFPTPSPGFDNTEYLYLWANNLTGALPPALGAVASNMYAATGYAYMDLCDNLFTGALPTTWQNVSRVGKWYLSFSYNPLLVGPPPVNLSVWAGNCGRSYLGTSIGLDQPLPFILGNASAALDPSGLILDSWNNPSLQWCSNYVSQAGTQPGFALNQARLGYGVPRLGVTCSDSATVGYNTIILSGLGLAGTLPANLYMLRTTTQIQLQNNALSGTIPNWGATNYSWTYFTPSAGFDSVSYLYLQQNALTGTLPPGLGRIAPATTYFGFADNLLQGTIPAAYTGVNYLSVSYNPGLYGTVPAGVTLWTLTTGFSYLGTSLGLDRPMAAILQDVRAALDPWNNTLTSWNNVTSPQPCAPYAGQPSVVAGTGWAAGTPRAAYGGSWAGVLCSTGIDQGGVYQVRAYSTARQVLPPPRLRCSVNPSFPPRAAVPHTQLHLAAAEGHCSSSAARAAHNHLFLPVPGA